ncbi:hypothetical protein AG1IA_06102 [Rhizoctonia solani AG-1 IA]|uniref:Uncharacterized protein n=1 Tax=Thanatephorus cucumeris (strain AG1-IA) TaxID=983506 RepID=L8WPH5_THACA|nr:hypothetical protein AG1IA_06102 [Rhizoctonia solani AG-1 IA]
MAKSRWKPCTPEFDAAYFIRVTGETHSIEDVVNSPLLGASHSRNSASCYDSIKNILARHTNDILQRLYPNRHGCPEKNVCSRN